MNLWTVFREEFAPVHLRGKARKTREHYVCTLASIQEFLQRLPLVADLNEKTISAWLMWLEEQPYRGRRRSPHTINGRRGYALSLASWLNRRGRLPIMPDVPKVEAPLPIPMAWTREQLLKLYMAACQLRGTCKGVPASALWRAWILVAWDTGERTGAMLALRSEWLADDLLIVPGASRKGKKAATYRLKPATVRALWSCGFQHRERIFPVSFPTYRHWFGRILKSAGLPDCPRSLNHRLRRSFASHLKAAGEDASEALQHSSRDVTERSYLDPRIARPRPANRKLFDLDAG